MEPLTLGALAGFGIAIPVGAIAVLTMQTGITRGFRCAASAGAGAATADLLYSPISSLLDRSNGAGRWNAVSEVRHLRRAPSPASWAPTFGVDGPLEATAS